MDAVGVRLGLGAAGVVLGVPAHVLTDRRVHLHELWGPAAATLVEQIAGAGDALARAGLLQAAIVARGVDASQLDPVTRHLAHGWVRAGASVREMAGEVGLSERQLRRRCEATFGYPPSFLRRLLRLQRFLASARAVGSRPPLADLAVAAGYADQAHLSRETRALTGRSPSQCLPAPVLSDPFKTAPALSS